MAVDSARPEGFRLPFLEKSARQTAKDSSRNGEHVADHSTKATTCRGRSHVVGGECDHS